MFVCLIALFVTNFFTYYVHNEFKQEAPVTRSIKKWSDEADAKLQDCFASTDWNMFRDSFDGIEEYTTSFIGLIN